MKKNIIKITLLITFIIVALNCLKPPRVALSPAHRGKAIENGYVFEKNVNRQYTSSNTFYYCNIDLPKLVSMNCFILFSSFSLCMVISLINFQEKKEN